MSDTNIAEKNAQELVESITRRFVSLGSGLHGRGLLIGLCRDVAEEIAREGEISQSDIDDLVGALRDRGFGKREFHVTLQGLAHVTVQATDESEAEEMARDMDWSEYEVEDWEVTDVMAD
jgi:hypothetical protein